MAVSLLLLASLLQLSSSTTEWWGDLRAHLNPPRAPAFYDVTYDDNECMAGLRADAIPDYVYFGTMIATFIVEEHDECLRRCIEKPRCKSVNFFHPLAYQEKGFCELLSETQHDNPRLMRPFRRAIHYEKIRCKEDADGDVPTLQQLLDNVNSPKAPAASENKVVGVPRPSLQKNEISALMKKLAAKVSEFNHKGGASPAPFRA